MISQYSNLVIICSFLLSPIFGFNNVLTATLIGIAHKYDNQYLWLITTFFLSLFTFGFSKSFLVLLFTLIYHGFYNNKLNKEVINNNINKISNMLLKYKYIVNLKNKINSIHIHPTIQHYNEKLNIIIQQLETIILNSFIKNEKVAYHVIKENSDPIINDQSTFQNTVLQHTNENNEVISNDIVTDKTNEFISNLLGIPIDQVKDLSKDSTMGLTPDEFKMLQTLINSN